jgi:cell division septation protein DedD
MQLVFTKNEDNVNEIFASLRDSAFNQYLEDEEESEEELSDNLD